AHGGASLHAIAPRSSTRAIDRSPCPDAPRRTGDLPAHQERARRGSHPGRRARGDSRQRRRRRELGAERRAPCRGGRPDGAARRARLTTAHGAVDTPAFMPVGTRGTVKALGPDDLIAAGAQIVLANTYHLLLRPGHDLIRDLGGLHRFMAWDGPILTDSGGFQVFSLAKIRTMSENGVEFRSPIDGSTHLLTPERSIEIQHALGADIIHPLDECLAYPATREATERSLALTLRWARRAQAAHAEGASQATLFGIVQGGAWDDVRERAVAETVALGFDGY